MRKLHAGHLLLVLFPFTLACGVKEDHRAALSRLDLQTVSDCPEGLNVVEGTNFDDRLRGTNGADCLLGYEGDDLIWARAGDDYIVGGQGDDTIFGNAGDDQIFGEAGSDVLVGNRGSDLLVGGEGDDLLIGGLDTDVVFGGTGSDTILDPSGEDVITDDVGNGVVSVGFNAAPVVRSIVPFPTRLDLGDATALTVDVFDPDGDEMTFVWTANCAGTFSAPDAGEPIFTLQGYHGALCTLRLEVHDNRGGQATGSITIATGAIEPVGQAIP